MPARDHQSGASGRGTEERNHVCPPSVHVAQRTNRTRSATTSMRDGHSPLLHKKRQTPPSALAMTSPRRERQLADNAQRHASEEEPLARALGGGGPQLSDSTIRSLLS